MQLAADLETLRALPDDLLAIFAHYQKVTARYQDLASTLHDADLSDAQMQALHADYPAGVHSILSEDGVWNVLVEVRSQYLRLLKTVVDCVE